MDIQINTERKRKTVVVCDFTSFEGVRFRGYSRCLCKTAVLLMQCEYPLKENLEKDADLENDAVCNFLDKYSNKGKYLGQTTAVRYAHLTRDMDEQLQ